MGAKSSVQESMLGCQISYFLCFSIQSFWVRVLGVYACACFMHMYANSKCVYAYNWDTHTYPMYVHAHSCPETLIHFYLVILYFILHVQLLLKLVFHIFGYPFFYFVLLHACVWKLKVCVHIQLGCARIPYVCARTLVSRTPNSLLFGFSLFPFTCFASV